LGRVIKPSELIRKPKEEYREIQEKAVGREAKIRKVMDIFEDSF